ncbi:MAG: hypothetical protein OEU54_05370 [Gemmatimonadota bacterium]|nr:hypothetical protein [Gemmatimonadota bacterium]
MKNIRSRSAIVILPILLACNTAEVAGPANPADASLNQVPQAPLMAIGSGHVPAAGGQRVFTFHAANHPDGTTQGSYRIGLTGPGLYFSVDVTCMTIVDNTAWVAGLISESNASFIDIGSVSYFYAIDDGEGEGSADIVSTARFNDIAGEDLRFCAERPLGLPSFPIAQGNVQVG